MISDHPASTAAPSRAIVDTPPPAAPPAPRQRLPQAARRLLLAGGMTAASLGLAYAATLGLPPGGSLPPSPRATKSTVRMKPVAARSTPAPEREEDHQALVESLVRSQKKRIMGRKRSLPDVARVVTLVGPLVARALEQPSIQADLRLLAQQNGMSLAEYKRYFRGKQEADLLLESGGDPNARSVSDAIGVAQFLAGTARASGGLKVNLPESRRLSGRIARLQGEITTLEALPDGWTKPLPGGTVISKPQIAATPAAPAPGVRTEAAPQPAQASSASPAGTSPAGGSASGIRPANTTAADAEKASPAAPAALAGAAPAEKSVPTTGEALKQPAAADHQPADIGTVNTERQPNATEPAMEETAPSEPAPANPSPPGTAKPALPTPTTSPSANPVVTRDELVGKRSHELRLLEAKRRQVDERYDPGKAIAAQTRYLVRMTRRYGSLDWVFQAYHGGEGGVRNTVSYYLGDRWRQFASAEYAIRGTLASRGGGLQQVRPPLRFEELYFKTTPLAQPAAFSYLYGRSDNHRYYWWKILAAERAIDLYRRDPAAFRAQWRRLRPGQRLEVVWYPRSKELNFHDLAALERGYEAGQLVHWPAGARSRGLVLGDIAPMDRANAFRYKGLRPEALGALYRIAQLYMTNGGSKLPLRIHSLVQTEEYRARLNALRPPSWMRHPTKPEEIPIDMEPTGLCFDLERPATDWNRKVLEYALGWLADRNQIYWVEESEQGPRRYHICPSPEFRRDLARGAQPRGPKHG